MRLVLDDIYGLDKSTIQEYMYLLAEADNVNGVRVLSQETGVPPPSRVLASALEFHPAEDLLWLIESVTIDSYTEDAGVFGEVLYKTHDIELLKMIMDKLISSDCRDYMVRSITRRPLHLFDNTTYPINPELVPILEEYGFNPMPQPGQELRGNILGWYSHDTEGDRRMYNYLVDVMGVTPDEGTLRSAVSNGNLELVRSLIETGIPPGVYQVILAIKHGRHDIARELYSNLSNKRVTADDLIRLGNDIMTTFVQRYWMPSVEELIQTLDELWSV